jgi:hypothetical protein
MRRLAIRIAYTLTTRATLAMVLGAGRKWSSH